MYRTRLALLFGFLLLPSTSTAQSPRRTNDEQATWLAYTGIHPLSPNWRLQLEAQLRQTEGASQPQQRLFRTALLRVLMPGVRAGAGFATTRTYPPDEFVANPAPFSEHRVYEQLDLRQPIGRLVLDHRYRLEQRWVERLTTTSTGASEHDGWTYTNRARYFLRTIVAPGGGPPENGETYFVGYDEVFVNFGQNVRANIFDQNRIFAGVGHRWSAAFSLEVGYLNQIVLRSNGTDVERNHTILIGLQSEAPFRK
ncbi:MAG TPA: DUF2490 domain-containing protein [Gemmatimonadaceae bacterium]